MVHEDDFLIFSYKFDLDTSHMRNIVCKKNGSVHGHQHHLPSGWHLWACLIKVLDYFLGDGVGEDGVQPMLMPFLQQLVIG